LRISIRAAEIWKRPGATSRHDFEVKSDVQTIQTNVWHHMLIRRTSGTYELFYNNVSIATVTSENGSSSDYPLLIGRRNATDGRDFSLEGSIDEIAIWSRSLSYAEIEALYNDGEGLAITEPKVTITGIDVSQGNAILQWQGDRTNAPHKPSKIYSKGMWNPKKPQPGISVIDILLIGLGMIMPPKIKFNKLPEI